MLNLILDFIFGTYHVVIDKDNLLKTQKLLLLHRIPIKRGKDKDDKTVLVFDKKYCSRIVSVLEEHNVKVYNKYNVSIGALLKKYKKRPGLFVGIICLVISVFVSKAFIWNISVTGNDRLTEDEVLHIVEQHGVFMGAFIPSIDLHNLYNDILIDNDDICWISVNIRGTHASVEIREANKNESKTPVKDVYANIVALYSGRITSIESYGGQNIVNIGDAVVKGDLLVSGFYEDKTGRNVISYPRARIYADVIKDFTVEVPFVYQQKKYTGEESKNISFIFFSKRINIINNSGNPQAMYDIIEDKEQLSLFDCVYFPLFVSTMTICPYEYTDAERTEEEALQIARHELSRQILDFAPSGEILSKNVSESITEDKVIIKAQVLINTDIAKIKEFTFNKE